MSDTTDHIRKFCSIWFALFETNWIRSAGTVGLEMGHLLTVCDALDAANARADAAEAALKTARDDALREAVTELRRWQDDLIKHRYADTPIVVGMAADVILALITKEPK
jgi:hypothetical protein